MKPTSQRGSPRLVMTLPVFALMALLLPSCSQGPAPPSFGDVDLQAAVFRYQVDHNGSRQQKNAKAFYLCLGEDSTDPSDELLKRLADIHPPVRRFSECNAVSENGVLDKKARDPGVVLRLVSVTLVSNTEAKVKGGFFEGPGSAAGNIYTLVRQGGDWQVASEEIEWQDHTSTEQP